MTASLLGEPEAIGNMTSGGTESILMAVKTARDRAREEKGISEPEMILPVSAHPAFDKSAQYLGVKAIHAPLGDDLRVDVSAMQEAITPNTVLMVGSAPNFPFGTIDPIPEIAAAASERDIPCHVDACVGGFLAPFVRKAGYDAPAFDLAMPGVSSISADLHKYGYISERSLSQGRSPSIFAIPSASFLLVSMISLAMATYPSSPRYFMMVQAAAVAAAGRLPSIDCVR